MVDGELFNSSRLSSNSPCRIRLTVELQLMRIYFQGTNETRGPRGYVEEKTRLPLDLIGSRRDHHSFAHFLLPLGERPWTKLPVL